MDKTSKECGNEDIMININVVEVCNYYKKSQKSDLIDYYLFKFPIIFYYDLLHITFIFKFYIGYFIEPFLF